MNKIYVLIVEVPDCTLEEHRDLDTIGRGKEDYVASLCNVFAATYSHCLKFYENEYYFYYWLTRTE